MATESGQTPQDVLFEAVEYLLDARQRQLYAEQQTGHLDHDTEWQQRVRDEADQMDQLMRKMHALHAQEVVSVS